ncbi:MAG: NADH-quinone oxidoreductase subunit L [Verrucomicrobia bacterium]|nr:NADH-quinone oxidoreductase subunit L [Kiritimatiellia bacterium]MCP5487079.1 NADH-quinone oxidoreductase subunit L [Verrucomicrobiota bacterium]
MERLVFLLIAVPLLGGILQAVMPGARARHGVIWFTCGLTILLAHAVLVMTLGEAPIRLNAGLALFERQGLLPAEIALIALIGFYGIRYRNPLAVVLAGLQALLLIGQQQAGHPEPLEQPLLLDGLAVMMVMIIGVVGGGIGIHAIGYMQEHREHHPEGPDRRASFFFVVFLFLSAMFGLVLADSLPLLLLFWEITTLCSFLLIGFERTPEAMKNAFKALNLNLIGGFGIGLAILHQSINHGTPTLSSIASGAAPAALLAAALIAIAGLAKSAQFPFSSWLLGAMVAPTPVSALLHSSTMVKAGVYVIIRCAPVFHLTPAGFILSLIGAITFLLTSTIAATQSNAKRVLAYSTIANLGLIVTCAGIGSHQAVWAAMLLIIFHAVAKALLFLSVGTVEHKLGSRDIEDMNGLIVCNPRLALAMLIGAAGMFLAPFGMLISKWAAIEALIQANPILPIIIAFGSAPTLFFWTKWMGKLLACRPQACPAIRVCSLSEQAALGLLAALTIGICAIFPMVSSHLIEPYLALHFSGEILISRGNLITMFIMLALIGLLPFSLVYRSRAERMVTPYLCGANLGDTGHFTGSADSVQPVYLKNYYLHSLLDEATLFRLGLIASGTLMLVMFAAVGW